MLTNNDHNFQEELEIVIFNILDLGPLRNHLLVYEIDSGEKRKAFMEVMAKTNWIDHNSSRQNQSDESDYVYINDEQITAKALYNIFLKYIDKTIIFDTEVILRRQALIDILEGAICSSPDSAAKWPVYLEGYKEFVFKGSVIILTSQSEEKFKNKGVYHNLLRDMILR